MTESVVAREYQRVSFDKSGRERSQDEQHGDNERAAHRFGWALGKPYRDTGSASRYARKAREDFGRLMADLESGAFGAEVLMLWESSRGSRKVSEWCALIEACEAAKVKIFITSDSRLYDPSDPRDVKSLQEDAVDSQYESGKTHKRVVRSHAGGARDGRPGPGQPAYGFRRVYDPATGRLTGQEIEPVEAAIVRELYNRLSAGHSLRAIAADLGARGVLTRAGRAFSPHTLRSIALNRANIAERVHDPAPARRTGKPSSVATITAATWPPIVDRALWTAIHHRLTDPTRTTTRPARGVHWLTWLGPAVVCDVCDGPLQARTWTDSTTGGPVLHYYCHAATHVRVPYAALDEYAEAALLEYLGRDDVAEALTAEPVDPTAVAAVTDEIAEIEQDIDHLGDQLGSGGPAARRLLERSLPTLEARLADARKRKDELTAPSLLRGLIEPGKDVRRRWKAVPMPARREIVRLVFVSELLGQMRVVKAPIAGRSAPIRDRVVWKQS